LPRALTGQTVVIDPGHGGADRGHVSPGGVAEKDVALKLGLRLAELLRADGCRVQLTRTRDESVPLYSRTAAAVAAGAGYVVSLHCNAARSPLARGAACTYFQRSHYYSEHGWRLAGYVGERLEAAGVPFIASVGRNYAILREPRAIGLLVEPLFLSNAEDEALARRADVLERLARALRDGFADYLTRAPQEVERP
jgi:N-acetylmuramoyl-L-alanine amidase